MDVDTLRAAAVGSGGMTVQFLDFLPDLVKIGAGIATIVYFVYKIQLIRKQLKE